MAANAQDDQYEFKIIAERTINALFQITIFSQLQHFRKAQTNTPEPKSFHNQRRLMNGQKNTYL
jgi:hypothetical protein